MAKLLRSTALIVAFTIGGVLLLKIGMVFVCWGVGHSTLEATAGVTASLLLGLGLGVEGFLSFKAWRRDRNLTNSR